MLKSSAVLAISLAVSAPAAAKTVFYGYDGPPVVKSGEGGTKITVRGVDFWTAGTPYRRYRILGTIVDDRMTGDGDAVGSKRVATTAKKAGADGVIFTEQSVQDGGIATGGTPAYGYVVPIGYAVSKMIAVKYLD